MDYFILFAAIFITEFHLIGGARIRWSRDCPKECQCLEAKLSQTMMSKWMLGETTTHDATRIKRQKDSLTKTVQCVIQEETNIAQLFKSLPEDTQVLTISQAKDSKPFTLMEKHLRPLQSVVALEIRGANDTPTRRITLSTDALKAQRKLQYLFLQNVTLSSVDGSPFNKLTGLKVLRLVQSGLQVIPPDLFEGLQSLEELSLELNNLEQITEMTLKSMPNLRRLYLGNNLIKDSTIELCSGVTHPKQLEVLDLSSNNITQLFKGVLCFPNLSALDLKHNPIIAIFPFTFLNMSHLRHLSLGHTEQPLHIVERSFSGLSSLRSLTLPNIDNEVLKRSILYGMTNLQHLVAQGNIWFIANNAFMLTPNLTKLTLRQCHIRRIAPEAFNGLRNLQHLDLSHNRLQKLPAGVFDSMKSLKELELQFNLFRVFPYQVVSSLPLKSLRLEGNMWLCTCDMARWDESIIGRVRKQTRSCDRRSAAQNGQNNSCRDGDFKYMRDFRLVPRCHNPPEHKGKPVFDIIKRELRCHHKKGQ